MTQSGKDETRLTGIGGMTGAVAGVALIAIVIVHLFAVPLQFEPLSNLLRSVASPQSQMVFVVVYWALAIVALLTIPIFLGLYQLLRAVRPAYSLWGAVLAVISSVMYSLSSIVYATTIPGLAAAHSSVSDQDLQRAIEFQASAFNALAVGIISVASLLFAVSLIIWSRAMGREFSRYLLLTLLLGVYALVTVLTLELGQTLPRLGLMIFEGAWLVLVGIKIAMLNQTRHRI